MTRSSYEDLQRSYTVEAGDVVLALVGATTGKSAVVQSMHDVTVQRSIGILRPDSSLIDSHYLNLVLKSGLVQSQIRRVMDKYAAQPGIYLDAVAKLQVVFPELVCQRAVVEWVSRESHSIDESITLTENEIQLIREFRTRLISDVVTGKFDVRAAAAALPDLEETDASSLWTDEPPADDPEDESQFEADDV